ncbi:MAG: hypothetical protein WB523_03535, partial [Candidatus Sulfotelmatobacter sp.]
ALLHCRGANLLHCRSPLSLCFEHVDNLGAYRIPSETGLLIPSGFDDNPQARWYGAGMLGHRGRGMQDGVN